MATSGKKRGNYRRTCYPHEFGLAGKQYDFAEDHDDEDEFLEAYEHLPYDLIEKDSILITPTDCLSHAKICNTCSIKAYNVYSGCTLRRFGFLLENKIRLAVSYHPAASRRCPKCGAYSSVSGSSRNISRVEIRDVRLKNMPVKILVRRTRPMCSNENCRNLLGERRIVGLESYASGSMSLRLTASVLACHLNGISRRYIAEAYAISSSQIDRIKARVIDMMKDAKSEADLSHVIFEGIRIERERFDITDLQDSPIFELYFDYCSSSGDLKLASVYKKSTMEGFRSFLQTGNTEYLYGFSSQHEFVLTGMDYYAGHCGTSGRKLLEHVAALGIYYSYIMSYIIEDPDIDVPMPAELHDALNALFTAMKDGKHSLKAILNKVTRMYHKSTQPNNVFNYLSGRPFQSLWKAINTTDTSDHLTRAERRYVKQQRTAAMKAAAVLIQKSNASRASKSDFTDQDFIDRLLYFNPAVIPRQVIDLFATVEGDTHLAENDYRPYMGPITYGIPLACLRHLLDSDLLSDGEQPLHCHLTGADALSRPQCDLYPLLCPCIEQHFSAPHPEK